MKITNPCLASYIFESSTISIFFDNYCTPMQPGDCWHHRLPSTHLTGQLQHTTDVVKPTISVVYMQWTIYNSPWMMTETRHHQALLQWCTNYGHTIKTYNNEHTTHYWPSTIQPYKNTSCTTNDAYFLMMPTQPVRQEESLGIHLSWVSSMPDPPWLAPVHLTFHNWPNSTIVLQLSMVLQATPPQSLSLDM